MSELLLGCIADDFTGATDLANTLVRAGMRAIQTIGVPDDGESMHGTPLDAEATVVALKSRTAPVQEALDASLRACRWLRRRGARQIYFKICSTFDSTPNGNIGPVIDALMHELQCRFSIVTPAFPDTGRTVYQGHLFVGEKLLSESGMQHHPLTPMTDANLVRFLETQMSSGRKVGLISHQVVADSTDAILSRMHRLEMDGYAIAIADAISNKGLTQLGAVLKNAIFATGASGLAGALPANWGFQPSLHASELPCAKGFKAIISGSCSRATNEQVAQFLAAGGAAYSLRLSRLAEALQAEVEASLAWARGAWDKSPRSPLLVYSTADPVSMRDAQALLGPEAGTLIEQALAIIARRLVEYGAGALIVAGGETSGACVQSLGVRVMRIGRQICPGVPWCYAESPASSYGAIHLTLKSGNFGSRDFFEEAFSLLDK
jgi:uncharacterized protein YgbK (DUF1537 family)